MPIDPKLKQQLNVPASSTPTQTKTQAQANASKTPTVAVSKPAATPAAQTPAQTKASTAPVSSSNAPKPVLYEEPVSTNTSKPSVTEKPVGQAPILDAIKAANDPTYNYPITYDEKQKYEVAQQAAIKAAQTPAVNTANPTLPATPSEFNPFASTPQQAANQAPATVPGAVTTPITSKPAADASNVPASPVQPITEQITSTPASPATSTEYESIYRDTSELEAELNSLYQNAQQQAINNIDYTTGQNINELYRAMQDAQLGYDEQRKQLAIAEAQNLDNSALYSELRGDNGGIGQAQFNSIQAAAANGQAAVNREQQKLATDTARQVNDLRAQGDYKKADAVLQLNQSKLAELTELKKWAMDNQFTEAQWQEQLNQWKLGYELDIAQITGEYKGQPTYSAAQNNKNQAISLIEAYISNGVSPANISDKMLADAGMTRAQINDMFNAKQASDYESKYQASQSAQTKARAEAKDRVDTMISQGLTAEQIGADLITAAGYTVEQVNSMTSTGGIYTDSAAQLYAAASQSTDPEAYIRLNAKSYGITTDAGIGSLIKNYRTWANTGPSNTGAIDTAATTSYQDVAAYLAEMKASGTGTAAIRAALTDAYNNKLITASEYSTLYNKYR